MLRYTRTMGLAALALAALGMAFSVGMQLGANSDRQDAPASMLAQNAH